MTGRIEFVTFLWIGASVRALGPEFDRGIDDDGWRCARLFGGTP